MAAKKDANAILRASCLRIWILEAAELEKRRSVRGGSPVVMGNKKTAPTALVDRNVTDLIGRCLTASFAL